jgi:hypothetical protein
LTRVSPIDALKWVSKLRKNQMTQFEFKDLPIDLKIIGLLRRAGQEQYIVKVSKNVKGKIVWRLADNIKVRLKE